MDFTKEELELLQKEVDARYEEFQKQEAKLLKEKREKPEVVDLLDGRNATNQLKRLTPKDKEEIVSSGSIEEVGYMLGIALGTLNTTALDYEVSDSDLAHIKSRFSKEQRKKINTICAELLALNQFEKDFKYDFLNFQKDAAFLARWVATWQEYDDKADSLTDIYRTTDDENITKIAHAINVAEGVTLGFDKEKDAFFINIGDPEDVEFSANLRIRVMYLRESMEIVKAKILAIERYIEKKKLPMGAIPYTTAVLIEDIKEEAFFSTFFLSEKFFKSQLNERLSKGEKVSSIDIEKAVFPDYAEIAPQEEVVGTHMIRLDEYTRMFSQNIILN